MTAHHNGTAGQVYYAKPLPIIASPWDGDDVALSETGSTGWFSFTNDPTKAYAIYRRIGASPASSDEVVAQVESGVVQSGDAFARLGAPEGASIAADIAAIEGGSGGAGLTGPYARTIIVTDAADDEPIEGALVRLYRTGETETKATDEDGETVPFATGAYTYSYAVTANGYAGATGIIAISGDGTTTIELTAVSITVPDDPALATLVVKCLDEAGAPEPGAVVYVRLVGIPTGSTGLSFDGISQEATANSDGNATLTIVKLAKYEIRRGGSKAWKPFTAGSGNSQTMESFVGVDPA